uniref:Uncharacterized protein n=1 Tax=Ditylenchus dipsaci TaxID=166011 RepID=A0A915E4M5_9BILA
MGFKDSLIGMVSDFVELKRNPEFRSKTDISSSQSTSSIPLNSANRRHSLSITVGTVEATPEKAIRQRTFSVSTEAGKLKDRRDSSDSTSLKVEPSMEEEGARYAGKGRRASEPLNFVPVNWNTARSKQSRNLLGKSKRRPLVASSSLEDSSISHKSPPRLCLPTSQEGGNSLGYEEDSPPRSPVLQCSKTHTANSTAHLLKKTGRRRK